MTTTTKTTERVSTLTTDKAAAVECWQTYGRTNEDRLTAFYRMGEHLLAVKESLAHGEFMPWLDTVSIPSNQAQRAMRIAKLLNLSNLIEAGSVYVALAAIAERDKPTPHLYRRNPLASLYGPQSLSLSPSLRQL